MIPPEGNVLESVEEKPHDSKNKRVMSRGKGINVKYIQNAWGLYINLRKYNRGYEHVIHQIVEYKASKT